MRIFQLKSKQGDILHEGQYHNFNACLEDAVGRRLDLRGIDLSAQNLSNANLDEARMEGAVFRQSNLTGANLSEASLRGADFGGAVLYNACLCESDLRDCDFEDASFGATDLAGAVLSGSRFSTLSSFLLDFAHARDMAGCVFRNPCGEISAMSRPPVVIHGLFPRPSSSSTGMSKSGVFSSPGKTGSRPSRSGTSKTGSDWPEANNYLRILRNFLKLGG